MYQDIVIPVDETEISMDSLEEAVKFQECNDIKIHGIYVDSRLAEDRYRENVEYEERVSQLPELERKASELGIEYEVGVIGERKPHVGICEYAERVDADVIIMSTHSRRGLVNKLLFNSVTKDTITEAPCPVIAIPHPD
jgi:nucleotide-binding universal stress UspA family protein